MRIEFIEECGQCGRSNDAGAMTVLSTERNTTHTVNTTSVAFGDICGCRRQEIARRGIRFDANNGVHLDDASAWHAFLNMEEATSTSKETTA
jgi:hypothetical protein